MSSSITIMMSLTMSSHFGVTIVMQVHKLEIMSYVGIYKVTENLKLPIFNLKFTDQDQIAAMSLYKTVQIFLEQLYCIYCTMQNLKIRKLRTNLLAKQSAIC